MNFFYYLIMFAVLLMGCRDKGKKELSYPTKYNSNQQVKITYDSLSIKITKREPNFYSTGEFYSDNDILFYYGYNALNNTIDVFEISPRQQICQIIKLAQKGPNRISKVEGLYIHNKDSLFVMDFTANKILILNSNGIVSRSFKINAAALSTVYFSKKYFKASGLSNFFFYDSKLDRILISTAHLNYSGLETQRVWNNYFNNSCLAEFDLKTQIPKDLELNFSKDYLDRYFPGFENPVFAFLPKRQIMVGVFPISSKVYEYNLSKNETFVYCVNSKFTDSVVRSYSWRDIKSIDKTMKYIMNNSFYYSTASDDVNDLWFRIHTSEAPEDEISNITAYKKKKLYLTIMDKNYAIVGEELLNFKGINPYKSKVFQNCLYIPSAHKNKNQLAFKLVHYESH